ncbi:MAG: hypothetical protein AABX51_00815 [Nanoarchaeota archaeon]
MAMFGMGKKEAPPPPVAAENAIVDEIRRLQSQGMQNPQIVQQLQRQGYKTYQIFDAFNAVDLTGKAGPIDQPVPPDPNMLAQQGPPSPQQEQGVYPQQQMGAYAPQGYSQMAAPQMLDEPQYDELEQVPEEEEQIEELVEAIVEEKWEELVRNVNKVIGWKNVMENRLAVLEQRFTDLKMQFDDINKGIIDKMGEYDQNIINVGTEIKAMEQVFQKVLPTFTENINELARLTKQMKQSQTMQKK